MAPKYNYVVYSIESKELCFIYYYYLKILCSMAPKYNYIVYSIESKELCFIYYSPWAHGGQSRSLASFRVWRTNFASAPHQDYSPPIFLAIFRWRLLVPQPSVAYFWERLCPRLPAGTRRPLAKSHAIPSPADKLRPRPHQGYSPPVSLAIFRWGLLAPRPSGAYFLARLCPRVPAGTRRPLAKSRPIPSPADEVGPSPPPRL